MVVNYDTGILLISFLALVSTRFSKFLIGWYIFRQISVINNVTDGCVITHSVACTHWMVCGFETCDKFDECRLECCVILPTEIYNYAPNCTILKVTFVGANPVARLNCSELSSLSCKRSLSEWCHIARTRQIDVSSMSIRGSLLSGWLSKTYSRTKTKTEL